MFKKTLVCLDGSKLAEEAIPYVINACHQPEAELVLFQVFTSHITIPSPQSIHTLTFGRKTKPGPTSTSDVGPFNRDADVGVEFKEIVRERNDATDYLEGLARNLRMKGANVKVVVWEGDIKESIISYISNHQISAVVLTTHGASGMGENLLGSVAQYIMKESPVPVVLVKPVGKPKEEEY
jgi:nucleotide-binding universal stress UspA family protein